VKAHKTAAMKLFCVTLLAIVVLVLAVEKSDKKEKTAEEQWKEFKVSGRLVLFVSLISDASFLLGGFQEKVHCEGRPNAIRTF
jgi:hypothetical protein